ADHPVDDQVSDDYADGGAQKRIASSAPAAGYDVTPPLPDCRRVLEQHLPAEQHQLAGDVEAVGQERPVARIGVLLGVHPADGEDHLVRLAGEQVSPAGPSAGEQTA